MYRKPAPTMKAIEHLFIGLIALSVCVTALCWSTPASAQDNAASETVEPTDEQRELNAQAVEMIVEGRPARAIALLEEARLLGKLNIIYLNLGRAYLDLGQCQRARESLETALEAPAIPQPSAKVVRGKVLELLDELDEACGDEASPESAAASSTDGSSVDDANRTRAIDTPPPGERVDSTRDSWGWAAVGSGTVLAAAGVGFHFWAESKRDKVNGADAFERDVNVTVTQSEAVTLERQANTLDSVGVGMMAAGGVCAGVGAYLLLSDASAEDSEGLSASFQAHSSGASIMLKSKF